MTVEKIIFDIFSGLSDGLKNRNGINQRETALKLSQTTEIGSRVSHNNIELESKEKIYFINLQLTLAQMLMTTEAN